MEYCGAIRMNELQIPYNMDISHKHGTGQKKLEQKIIY